MAGWEIPLNFISMRTMERPGLGFHTMAGKNRATSTRFAALVGAGIWKACVNIVKRARVKRLAVRDIDKTETIRYQGMATCIS